MSNDGEATLGTPMVTPTPSLIDSPPDLHKLAHNLRISATTNINTHLIAICDLFEYPSISNPTNLEIRCTQQANTCD